MTIKPALSRRWFERPEIVFGLIFIAAFAVRLIFAAEWHATPYGAVPILDAEAYHLWAQDIAAGHLLRERAFYQLPLYPYLLGALYAIWGASTWIASVFNALCDAGTCALLACLAFDLFGFAAAIVTGLLAITYGPFIFYTAPVMKESLGLFLLALSTALAFRAAKTGAGKMFLAGGVCLGLCALVRGNVLGLALILPVVLFIRHAPSALKKSGIYALGIVLAILPATLHNLAASRDFVPISYAGGFNAYIGNGVLATGNSYVFPPGVTSNPANEEYDISAIAEKAEGHTLTPSQVSAFWTERTLDYALGNPAHEGQLLLNKIAAFWSNGETFDNYDMRFIAQNFPNILSWPLPDFGLIAAMAAFALVAPRNRKTAAIAVVAALIYMLTLLPFYVTDRYRLPVLVFLLPLAGASAPALKDLLDRTDFRRFSLAALAAVIAAWLSFGLDRAAPNDAYDWSMLSTIYEDEGQHQAALEAFDRANALDPAMVGADAWIKIADAKERLGQKDEAMAMLLTAMDIFPNDASVTYNYGRMKFLAGDLTTAKDAFEKAIRQMPVFAPSYRGLASVYFNKGDKVKAIAIIRQGLSVVPSDRELKAVLIQLEDEKPLP